ncbi:MAG: hypothetical protein KF901_10675 [Myxococcales bacterium]|nr:hypothetical protein [Myxococcales bacterium]
MAVGFRFRQTLRGTYHRLADPGVERPAMLEMEIELPLRRLVRRDLGSLRGTLHADGLAASAQVEGTFQLDLFDGKIVYDLHFEAEDGRERRFHGETEFELRHPIRTLEDVVGRVWDEGNEEARVLLTVPVVDGTWRLLRTLQASFSTHLP